MQTYFHLLILIWIEMVCISFRRFLRKKRMNTYQPSASPVKGCELHPVLSKGHAEGVRVSTPYSIHCLPLHGCTNV